MQDWVFHRARIGARAFFGVLGADGPRLVCPMHGGVALGISSLRWYKPERGTFHSTPQLGWWVVKYGDEPRVFLQRFDLAEARQLGEEFGLCIRNAGMPEPLHPVQRECIFGSRAWDSLRRFVIRYPTFAQDYANFDAYLPGWYARATLEADLTTNVVRGLRFRNNAECPLPLADTG